MFPLKLEKLHLYGTFAVLLLQLLERTLYLKYVERTVVIIQRLKGLLDQDFMWKLLTYYVYDGRGFKPIITRVKKTYPYWR